MCISTSKWLADFLASMYTQIKAPHKILGFSIIFLFIIFFFVLNETKEGEFHLGPNTFFHRPPQHSDP
jgi:hypothetical protein